MSAHHDPAVGPSRLRSLLAEHAGPCGLILLVGGVVFGRAIFFDFVRYDDYELLVMNQGSVSSLGNAFASFWRDTFAVLSPESRGVFYRPLLVILYGLEAQVAGTHPLLYHLTNLVLHLAVSCLVYGFLRSFDVSRGLSLGLALVFLCHPCAVHAAAWIPGRNNTLLAIWCIVGAIWMRGYMREGRASLLAGSVLCYAGALFSKESGGALIAILGAIALLELSGRRERIRGLMLAGLATAGVMLLWALLRHIALGQSPVGASRIPDNLTVLLVYLGKTLFPIGLAPIPRAADSSLLPGLAALALLLGACAWAGRGLWGPAGLGLVWYASMLLPSLLVHESTWGLEHRIYVPLVGMLLFVASLPAPGWLRERPRLAPALALGVATVFGLQSAQRLGDYANALVFWESAARAAPSSPMAHSRVAWRYFAAERFTEMRDAIDRALELEPERADIYLLRGLAARRRNDLGAAERAFRRTIEIEPQGTNALAAWQQLADVHRARGRDAEAREAREQAEALRWKPSS